MQSIWAYVLKHAIQQRFEHWFKIIPKPVALGYAVTYLCDGKCTFCGIWKKYRETPNLFDKELSLSQIHEIFSENRSFLNDVRELLVSGGEPFLRKDFGDVLRVIHAILPKSRIMIATNGLNTDRILDAMKEILEGVPIHTIAVSLDGLKETHDAFRGVNGAFERAIGTLKGLSRLRDQHDFKLSISFTITPSNYREMMDVFRLSQELNAFFICRSVHSSFFYRNVGETHQSSPEVVREIRDMLSDIAIAWRKDYESAVEWKYASFYLSKIISYLSHPSKLVMPCFAGTYSLILDPYGFVYPCILVDERLGDATKSRLKEIWASRKAKDVRKNIEKGSCPNCWMDCNAFTNIKLDLFRFSKWTLETFFKEYKQDDRY